MTSSFKMNKAIKIAVLASAALGLAASSGMASAKPRLTAEEKLAKMLDGREPGKPVSCIPTHHASETRVFDKTAIAYRIGSTIYVNRPHNAQTLDDNDILVTRTSMSQLCNVDIMYTYDRSSPSFMTGSVSLGEFVPYRKVVARN